jgi:hypothetical protein
MAKKAKAKKAKAPKKKKAAKRAASKKPMIVPLTLSGLNRISAKGKPSATRGGAAAMAGGGASMITAGTPSPTQDSFVVVPAPNGSTVVCFFNPNTGNFDRCRTVQGSLGFAKT